MVLAAARIGVTGRAIGPRCRWGYRFGIREISLMTGIVPLIDRPYGADRAW